MTTLKTALILFVAMFIGCPYAGAVTPQEMCAKKNSELTCAKLNYTDSWNWDYNCSPCPIESEDKYSCVQQGTVSGYHAVTTDLAIKNAVARICEGIPTCLELGYRIPKTDMAKIPVDLSCSACPFDGNYWACADYQAPTPGNPYPSGGLVWAAQPD